MPNQELIAGFFTMVNRRELDRLAELLWEDAEFDFPKTQTLVGRDRILRFFKVLFRQYPQLAFDLKSTVVQGDRAVAHWTNLGENKAGEPYGNEGLTWFEFSDGRVRYLSDFFKDTSVF